MHPILTHRVSGVHDEARLAPVADAHAAAHAPAESAGYEARAWAQARTPGTAARRPGDAQALALLASPHGRAALAALDAHAAERPSVERIAELIDRLPTYPWHEAGGGDGDGSPRVLTDPALWVEALADAAKQMTQKDVHSPFYGNNDTALVFIMMLIAQRETTEGKRGVMKMLRMYSGMLDALSKLTARELMPAMREANRLAGQEKDPSRMDRIEVKLAFPKDIDTRWAHMDDKTGEVTLTMDLGEAPQRLETVQGITALMTLADQWRNSIQNQQTQQSTRFQALDNDSSSTLNIINGVLKISHEGASSAIRNLSA